MARVFVSASSQRLGSSGAVISTLPLTFACWFRTTSTTAIQRLIDIGQISVGNQKWSLGLLGTITTPNTTVIANAVNVSGAFAASSATYSANTWHHAAAVFASSTSRTAYLDGGSSGNNTTSVAPSGVDTTTIGATGVGASAYGQFVSGMIAFAAIWNAALSDDEILALGQKLNGVPCGVHPTRIRPESLVACWPLGGFDGDHDGDIWENAYNLTAYNSPTWDEGPAVLYSAGPLWLPAFTISSSDRTAAISGTMGAMSASLSAGFIKPTYTASIAGTHAPMTAALSASRTLPIDTASIVASHAPMVASLAASFTQPAYTATIGATNAAMTASLAATFATVQFSASIAATNAPMSAAVSATFDEPTYTASIAGTLGAMTSTVSATSATEIDTASIVATLGAMTGSLTAVYSDIVYVTTDCGIVPHFTRSTVPRFRRRNIVASIRRNTVPRFRRARR